MGFDIINTFYYYVIVDKNILTVLNKIKDKFMLGFSLDKMVEIEVNMDMEDYNTDIEKLFYASLHPKDEWLKKHNEDSDIEGEMKTYEEMM